ncbi:MAG: hypothetical protein GFH27_549409n9 [Chloroflexi bacterium AL-W]|nr:hypothetical protein [Chloroflexi bacterium AL-N1]NOK71344.1 hypothetical protein [Chloroflexi bacterium AL-N10]NOK78747.1 hypothetical protein [Chloroflexi bacterium AL-N5]NOK86117.1 hypothetical protein [Chloroflexi bacterium AL-W]NOK93070.1 hypothetical protein [Chloroflexi bacterium AL-N15]
MHSTNYTNVFIEVADDCKADVGTIPPEKKAKTVARMQYEMIHDNPYQYTSDDVIFTIYVARNGIDEAEWASARNVFFSKGQACLRSSSLGKTYGWGIHYDNESRVALYPCESDEYTRLKNDTTLTHVKAMKSSR